MKIRHNKFRNTGILFELLVRQVASDTVSGQDSLSIGLIKKYFSKSELAKEYKLYQTLVSTKILTEGKAESLINATLEISNRLNRSALRKEKYNLIKDISKMYILEEFFKSKINNYSQYAAAYRVLEEYAKMDKGTRILAYKILLERFNSKYNNMSDIQKSVLKEYINNISNTVKLREFVNESFLSIKAELMKLNKIVTDKTTQIKINEVVNILKPLDKNQNVKDDNIIALLQFHQLIAELKTIK